jgi:hypothetical protein
MLALACLTLKAYNAQGQTPTESAKSSSPNSTSEQAPSASTDLFVTAGSAFDRSGLVPRANYNIGIGHTFALFKKDPIGDELTFG